MQTFFCTNYHFLLFIHMLEVSLDPLFSDVINGWALGELRPIFWRDRQPAKVGGSHRQHGGVQRGLQGRHQAVVAHLRRCRTR